MTTTKAMSASQRNTTEMLQQSTRSNGLAHHKSQQCFPCKACNMSSGPRKPLRSGFHCRNSTPANTRGRHKNILDLCRHQGIPQLSCLCSPQELLAGYPMCERRRYLYSIRYLTDQLGFLGHLAAKNLRTCTRRGDSVLRRILSSCPNRSCHIRCWLWTQDCGWCCHNHIC